MSMALELSSLLFSLPKPNPNSPFRYHPQNLRIRCAKKSKRTGKFRYPSEKRKLKLKQETQDDVDSKFDGIWRLSKLNISVHLDPGKDFLQVSDALLEEIAKVLEFPVASMLPIEAFTVVRKSFDARKFVKEPKFVYSVDMDVKKLLDLEPRTWDFISRMEPKTGIIEHMPYEKVNGDIMNMIHDYKKKDEGGEDSYKYASSKRPKVAVVGSGPSGLFASLILAELGAEVSLIERGQPVEQRGRDIGALIVRRILQLESNFCFGEGGAGTWSDGKLVTRIGRNSNSVLAIMNTLIHFGAPKNILVDGKPHLGTDKLVPLLRNFRHHLQNLGVDIRFGTRVDDLLVKNGSIHGIQVSDSRNNLQLDSSKLEFDAVVLAVGHSARDIYQMLVSHDVDLVPKDFAIGLRIEHPQQLINEIQYSEMAAAVQNGRGKIPVADYKIVKSIDELYSENTTSSSRGIRKRGCYSFCMCPGGQVVLTSTNPSEICTNGMSFSRRGSKWANAALVVTVSPEDFADFNFHGPLAGVEFQRELEQRAARLGGGDFVVPAQRVTDFLENNLSGGSLPSSSYRLGVKEANLNQLFPDHITDALKNSLLMFDKELPGFISSEGLLHGVETRTSAPLQITRSSDTYESTTLKGLFPVGEGAGYAGGIVSAAVDGMLAGFAVSKKLGLYDGSLDLVLGGKALNGGIFKY
ncbi:uncharacterized protein Cbei_0202 [Impatiens glandulifera]|uniref:uncharacterized protein Cbei_0202 n=1 Tax=Impatiens glandulifera TaxID=253017 RepID=UPI001FB12872|nr:uncharacterized protein Cbei_0202 [Impatiens glandulifera]